jgi:hypothetical protein
MNTSTKTAPAMFLPGLCFCLLVVVLPTTAQASDPIVTGSVSCKGELQQLPNGFVGCRQPLPVRHLGKGGPGGVNPNEYGMCGILGVTMSVVEGVPWKDDVQIVVDSAGFYVLQLGISNTSVGLKPPEAKYTCVYFSGFTGLPPISDAVGLTPTPFSSGSSSGSALISGSAGYACIWAGFEGNLAGNPGPGFAVAQGGASAQYFIPETKYSAQNATSYAFCSGYATPSWKRWHYVNNSGGSTSTPRSLGINKKDYWCYMDLIQDDITDFGPAYTVIANINISSSGDYSLGDIFAKGLDSVSMGYNCLPLAQ